MLVDTFFCSQKPKSEVCRIKKRKPLTSVSSVVTYKNIMFLLVTDSLRNIVCIIRIKIQKTVLLCKNIHFIIYSMNECKRIRSVIVLVYREDFQVVADY